MSKIIGIGNALVDILAHIPNDESLAEMNLPKGSMQLIDRNSYISVRGRMNSLAPKRATGGSAANTMLALAHLGDTVGLIGKIGKDTDGVFYETTDKAAGIETRFLYSDLPTGIASTFISPDGQRTFATYLGAAETLLPDDICDVMFDGYDCLYLEGYLVQNHTLVDRIVSLARSRKMRICLDLSSYNIVSCDIEYFTTLVNKYIDVVFANEEESRAFTGLAPQEALHAIAACCDTAVVKLGADGSIAERRGNTCRESETASCPAGKVSQVVDTTAAGDFFAAGFLHALSCGCSLKTCLEAGTVLSSEIIQVVGTELSTDCWNNIRGRVNNKVCCRVNNTCN